MQLGQWLRLFSLQVNYLRWAYISVRSAIIRSFLLLFTSYYMASHFFRTRCRPGPAPTAQPDKYLYLTTYPTVGFVGTPTVCFYGWISRYAGGKQSQSYEASLHYWLPCGCNLEQSYNSAVNYLPTYQVGSFGCICGGLFFFFQAANETLFGPKHMVRRGSGRLDRVMTKHLGRLSL